jgi:hypothetical protein
MQHGEKQPRSPFRVTMYDGEETQPKFFRKFTY